MWIAVEGLDPQHAVEGPLKDVPSYNSFTPGGVDTAGIIKVNATYDVIQKKVSYVIKASITTGQFNVGGLNVEKSNIAY